MSCRTWNDWSIFNSSIYTININSSTIAFNSLFKSNYITITIIYPFNSRTSKSILESGIADNCVYTININSPTITSVSVIKVWSDYMSLFTFNINSSAQTIISGWGVFEFGRFNNSIYTCNINSSTVTII